jgi:hypothetical protein
MYEMLLGIPWRGGLDYLWNFMPLFHFKVKLVFFIKRQETMLGGV